MPRRITDPLNQGQTGKIYLQAYPETVSGYQLAKKIYEIDDNVHLKRKLIPPTSRVYTTLKSMRQAGYVVKIEDQGFLSNAEPAVMFLKNMLAGRSARLTTNEENKTRQILSSEMFRRQVALTDEFHNCSENGLVTVLRELGNLACVALVAKKEYPVKQGTVSRDFRAYVDQSASLVDKTYDEILRPLLVEDAQEEIKDQINSQMHSSIFEIVSFVLETDSKLLEKFVKLLSKEDYLGLKQHAKFAFIAAQRKV